MGFKGIFKPSYNTSFNNRHEVINSVTLPTNTYLEIGVEYGYTFGNIHCINKKGVDPDPKCKNLEDIYIYTSDDYFEKIHDPKNNYDIIFTKIQRFYRNLHWKRKRYI